MSKSKLSIVVFIFSFVFYLPLQAATWSSVSGGGCQILDNPVDPVYELGLGYVATEKFGTYGDSGMLELFLNWDVAYFRDKCGADLDVGIIADAKVFTADADIYLPDQLVALAVDLGGTWRYANGLSFQSRFRPGMYSDIESMEGGVFYVPFSGAFIKSFSPTVSGIAGLEIRPRYEQVVMPLIGIEWEINKDLRVSARLPESKATWFLNNRWEAYAGFEWNSTTYSLREKSPYDREKLSMEDFRLTLGAGYRMSDQIKLTCELGSVFNRSIEFEEDSTSPYDSEMDIENAVSLTFGLSGQF